jgi:thiol:disulfide interchange protein DsbD
VDVIAHTGRRAPAARRRTALASLALLFLLLAPGGVARADARTEDEPVARLVEREGEPRLVTTLLVDPGTRGAKGGARVGVLFELAPGWHAYWRNPGGSGMAPELDFELFAAPTEAEEGGEAAPSLRGATFGSIEWPVPGVFRGPGSELGLHSYGYVRRVLLSVPLAFEEPPAAGARIAAMGDILVCESECVPASFRLERPFGRALPGWTSHAERVVFEEFAARLPDAPEALGLEIKVGYSQSAIRPGDAFEAAIGVRSCASGDACVVFEPYPEVADGAIFLPHRSGSIELRSGRVHADPSDARRFWISFSGVADPEEPIEVDRLGGVVWLRGGGAMRAVEIAVPFPGAAAGAEVRALGAHWLEGAASEPEAGGFPLARALLLALLGGLVLNLMPCVLPILAIKVFSISEMARAAHADRREPLRHGAAYTLGILGSMAALAACVVVLRAAGHAVGWGFQFQEPIYVAAISAVLVAFALNLFGAFEIQAGAGALADLGQQTTGARRSFFEGLLAVALATPCSAPFLGTAVGFAFVSEPPVIAAIFLAVGLGLALPFLLVTLVPSWARFVPRSGAWMHTVRGALGFALLATVVWLLWILGRTAGAGGMVELIAFLLVLAFALWGFGVLQRSDRPRAALVAGLGVVVLSAAGLNAVGTQLAVEPGVAASEAAEDEDGWEAWSSERVEKALEAGAPVFVRFTADWCITCKVNERIVLKDEAVRTALERGGYRRFVADWTRRDDAIRTELARHGRAGVPLYLVYDPERPETPRLLSELLTLDATVAALRQAGQERDADHAQIAKPARSTGR